MKDMVKTEDDDLQNESDLSNSSLEYKEDIKVKQKSKKRKYEDIPNSGGFSKRKHKNDIYKPPTVEEINNLKETENLYNNNLFRLQIEELLAQINVKTKRKKLLQVWINSFEQFLKTLPKYELKLSHIQKISKAKSKQDKLLNKLAEYKSVPKTDQDINLKFLKPAMFEKFGLYECDSLAGPDLTVKINIIMPKACFLLKDFLNNRYLVKRYYYLLYMMYHLEKTDLIKKLSLDCNEGNFLIPILNVEPAGSTKVLVQIFFTPEENTFKTNRFLPDKNNVKSKEFDTDLEEEILKNLPTPFYNTALGHDVTLKINNDFIKETLSDLKSVQEAVKLITIWLKQREFNVGIGSFNETLVIYFMVYLYQKKKINKYMSSYQVIRNFWNFFVSSDLENVPISLSECSVEVLNSFKSSFDIVFLDRTGCYNITAFLTPSMYNKIKSESQFAVKLLDNGKNNSFQRLFLTKLPFYLQFDVIINLTNSLPFEKKIFSFSEQNEAHYLGYEHLLITNHILEILKRALNKRFNHLLLRLETSQNTMSRILIGLNLKPEDAFSVLEKGPALNDFTAAAEFRQFWGHLSSDRRFKDGSTNVAVHFKTNTFKAKRNIIKKIINFILDEKLNLKFDLHYDEFDDILVNKKILPSYPSGTIEETSLKIVHSSDGLAKILRSLQMSLKIIGVQGISNVYYFSDVIPPIPTNYTLGHKATVLVENNLAFHPNKEIDLIPRYIQPIKSVLQLEHSSKWPNDLTALRHLKTAFYIEISKVLQTEHKLLSNVTPEYIDIYFEGLVFRNYLNIPKEIGLLKRTADEKGITCYKENQKSLELDTTFNMMPKVIGALKGIHSQYPSFGLGTALIKRWLRSQLIDEHYFPDIVLSLLNASLYLDDTLEPVNTSQMSFLRFLKFISDFDWELHTVLVNFNDDITLNEITELETKLHQNRHAYPVLYIIMPYDQGLSVFSKNFPTKEILLRVKQLANESLNFINKAFLLEGNLDIQNLFMPNYEGYNVLIHLEPRSNSRRHEQLVFSQPKNRIIVEKYAKSDENKIPITDFSPVDIYLKTLRLNYGKYAMFFHDSYGGNVIGVLWNPKVFENTDFKVSRANATMDVDGKLQFNMDAVIEDFFILGKNLVKTIENR